MIAVIDFCLQWGLDRIRMEAMYRGGTCPPIFNSKGELFIRDDDAAKFKELVETGRLETDAPSHWRQPVPLALRRMNRRRYGAYFRPWR
jgi:hypothetical protein